VGFAAAIAALENEPASGVVGKLEGALIGGAQVALNIMTQADAVGQEVFKGAIAQIGKLANLHELGKTFGLAFGRTAGTGDGTAEGRMVGHDVGHDKAHALTVGTVGLAGTGNGGVCLGRFGRRPVTV
jgi:hypothetical protein